MFEGFDRNGDGVLSRKEFESALRDLNVSVVAGVADSLLK